MPNKASTLFLYLFSLTLFATVSEAALGSKFPSLLHKLNSTQLSQLGKVSGELATGMKRLNPDSYLVMQRITANSEKDLITTVLYENANREWSQISAVSSRQAKLGDMPQNFHSEFMVVKVGDDQAPKVFGKRFFKSLEQCSVCTFQPATGGKLGSWGRVQEVSDKVWDSQRAELNPLLSGQPGQFSFLQPPAAAGGVRARAVDPADAKEWVVVPRAINKATTTAAK